MTTYTMRPTPSPASPSPRLRGLRMFAALALAGTLALTSGCIYRMPIQQVLYNLIANAIKHHHKPSGRIEVSVEDRGEMYRFTVRDDGPGI